MQLQNECLIDTNCKLHASFDSKDPTSRALVILGPWQGLLSFHGGKCSRSPAQPRFLCELVLRTPCLQWHCAHLPRKTMARISRLGLTTEYCLS